jgi:hypothetical protein
MRPVANLENWFQLGQLLFGEVYGHPNFEDGSFVQVSGKHDFSKGVPTHITTKNTVYIIGQLQSEQDGPTKQLQDNEE